MRWLGVRAAVVTVIGLAWLGVGAIAALGCTASRSEPAGTPEELEAADVVFTGTVIGMDDQRSRREPGFDAAVWTFAVDGVEKGEHVARVTVFSSQFGASCGAGFDVGHRYLVYAHRGSGGELHASLGDAARIEPRAFLGVDWPGLSGVVATTSIVAGLGLLALVPALALSSRVRGR